MPILIWSGQWQCKSRQPKQDDLTQSTTERSQTEANSSIFSRFLYSP